MKRREWRKITYEYNMPYWDKKKINFFCKIETFVDWWNDVFLIFIEHKINRYKTLKTSDKWKKEIINEIKSEYKRDEDVLDELWVKQSLDQKWKKSN